MCIRDRVYTTRENTLDRGAVTKSRGSGIFPGYHEPETPKRKRTSLLYNSPHVSRVYSATQNHDVSDSPVAWPTRNGSHMHNMHVQRFQDSNERTDKNPWLGLRRVSVKRGVGVYLFLKNAVLGLGLGLTLTLTLTLTLNNPNPKTAFSKKRTDPDPAQRCTNTLLPRELWKRPSPIPMAIFFFAKKRVVLRQDQWRDDIRPTALSMDRRRSGSYWDEISICCVTLRAFFYYF